MTVVQVLVVEKSGFQESSICICGADGFWLVQFKFLLKCCVRVLVISTDAVDIRTYL
jgi:hypothetical protein